MEGAIVDVDGELEGDVDDNAVFSEGIEGVVDDVEAKLSFIIGEGDGRPEMLLEFAPNRTFPSGSGDVVVIGVVVFRTIM